MNHPNPSKSRYEINEQICKLLNSRDPKGMELLFETYYKPLVVWANTFLNDLGLAEDLVQVFFIDLWNQELNQTLKPETFTSFLRVIIRNRCYNHLNKKDILSSFISLEEIDCIFEEYDQHRTQIINKVMNEITQLPPRSQEIMKCVFIEGLKYREVADRYNISISTVKTLLGTSIQRLREKFSREQFADFLLFFCWR